MKLNKIFSILIIGLLSTSLWAEERIEDTPFKRDYISDKDSLHIAKKSIRRGNRLYKDLEKYGYSEQVPRIINFYLKANNINPNNAELNYKLGRTYMETTDHSYAAKHFEKVILLDPTIEDDVYLLAAKAQHIAQNLDRAIELYKEYLNTLKPREKKKVNASIQRYIKQCNVAKELIEKPIPVFIDNAVALNTELDEYNVVKGNDDEHIYFTSRRVVCDCRATDNAGLHFETILESKKTDQGYDTPTEVEGKITKRNQHRGMTYLSPDGEECAIYKSRPNGDIFLSHIKDTKKGPTWTRPKRFAKRISTRKYAESSLVFSSDKREVFFTRNIGKREIGRQNSDIYVAQVDQKGKWKKPVNLGARVNTPYQERGLFLTNGDKTLYFASDGPASMGGFDVFRTDYVDGNWSEPVNLGYPINSTNDDAFYTLTQNPKSGYISSNRDFGYGRFDIYTFDFFTPKPCVYAIEDHFIVPIDIQTKERVKEIAANVTQLEGVVSNEEGEKVFANIELVDNSKNISIAEFQTDSITGAYSVQLPAGVNYGMAVKAQGYIFHSENFDIPASAATQKITKNIVLKQLKVGVEIVLNNIFFDTGKATLRSESLGELNRILRLMSENPTMKVEIAGHTDSTGKAAANKVLSEKRAKAVVDYLIDNGIDADRLTYKGYGPDRPVATNKTAAGRQLNRRTEFKVLEITQE